MVAAIKREAFESEAEYRRFLRESHYTRRDVRERVEVLLFAERIQERVVAGVEGEVAAQKAFSKFVSEYEVRWKARTVCAPDYAVDRCSNAPTPNSPAAG
jgi:hypothetical protein